MNTMSGILTLVAKDLRIEARMRHTAGLIVVLGVLIMAVLALGLSGQGRPAAGGAATILWVACLFSGVLCFERTMRVEHESDALSGLLLSPIGPGGIYVAKLLTNLVLLLGLVAVLTPVGAVFLGLDVAAGPWSAALIAVLSMTGFAAVGTLFSAASASARASGGLVPLLVFPLTLPLAIVSTRAMVETGPAALQGLAILIAFDLIFLAAGWLTFEFLIDA